MIGNIYHLPTVTERLRKAANEFNCHSLLGFLQEHRGLRFGKIHLLLGATSAGKSTLVRTMLLDCILGSQEFKTGLYLSEETISDFYIEFTGNNIAKSALEKLVVTSEQDVAVRTGKEFFKRLETYVEAGCKVIFVDNLTTSRVYENARPNIQGEIVDYLKRFAEKHNVALICVAHTSKGAMSNNTRLIDVEDVRGSGALPNAAPIAWTLQRIDCGSVVTSVVRVAKHRGYNVRNKNFIGIYHAKNKVFCAFDMVDFEKIKDTFKNRDKV